MENNKQSTVRFPVAVQVLSRRSQRRAKGACLSCGVRICPGASGRKCSARRFTPQEWQALKKVKEWV